MAVQGEAGRVEIVTQGEEAAACLTVPRASLRIALRDLMWRSSASSSTAPSGAGARPLRPVCGGRRQRGLGSCSGEVTVRGHGISAGPAAEGSEAGQQT